MVEDFPTLGRPTMAILGSSSMFSIGSVVKCETTLSSSSPVPEPLMDAMGKFLLRLPVYRIRGYRRDVLHCQPCLPRGRWVC